jgi:hypothetical protein
MIGTTIVILCFHMVILASMAMLAVPAFMREWTIVWTIVLPPNAEVLEPVLVVPAFMPEWKIVWMVFLPPYVEVLALVSVVPAFMPEWTIVLMIVLPPNLEVLALVSVVPAFMPEWTIVLMIVLPPNVEVLAQVSVVPAFMPEWKIVWMVFLPPNVEVLALVSVVSAFMPEWTIVSMIVLPPNGGVLAPVSVVPAFMPEWTIVSTIVLPPNVEALAQVPVVPLLTVKERDDFCSKVLGVRSRYRHLLDKSIFNLGFVYERGGDNFSSADSTSSLTNLGILNQERWRSGILSVHFIFPAEKQASNTRTAEGPHYQATFLVFILAMKQYRGPDIRFVFYDPTVNHSTDFLFILNGESATKYTSAIAWLKIKKRIGLDCPSSSLLSSNTVRQAAGNYANYGFCSSQISNQKESITGQVMPALKENSKAPEIVDAFVALTLFGSKTRPSCRLHEEHFSQIAADVLSHFAGEINKTNKLSSLHTAITSIHQPCGCHNDGTTNSKIHPDFLCASIIDGDKRISCNAQQRKSIDDYKLRCDDFEEALTAIEHVYRNLEPYRRSVTGQIDESVPGFSMISNKCNMDPTSYSMTVIDCTDRLAVYHNLSLPELHSLQMAF